MTSGLVMSAMTRMVPPHKGHKVMSMLKTRLSRRIGVINRIFQETAKYRKRKQRVVKVQCAGIVNLPWTDHLIRVSESDVFAFVMSEIQVVPAQGPIDPLRYPDQRRPVDIDSETRRTLRCDDGVLRNARNLHVSHLGRKTGRD